MDEANDACYEMVILFLRQRSLVSAFRCPLRYSGAFGPVKVEARRAPRCMQIATEFE